MVLIQGSDIIGSSLHFLIINVLLPKKFTSFEMRKAYIANFQDMLKLGDFGSGTHQISLVEHQTNNYFHIKNRDSLNKIITEIKLQPNRIQLNLESRLCKSYSTEHVNLYVPLSCY